MRNRKKQLLTEGSILKSLFNLALPIIGANILQTVYQLTDTFWVGRLGTKAVAAVSLSFPLLFLVISLAGGLTVAGTILVSQYKGEENQKIIDYIATQSIIIIFIVSLLFAILGYIFSPFLIHLLKVEKDVFLDALKYLRISFLTVVFIFIFMTFQSLMRAIGEVKIPMFIILVSVSINFVLDPLFILGNHFMRGFGVAGAAIATFLTQFLASIISIMLLLKGKYQIKINFKKIRFDKLLIKKMLQIGIPSSIEQSTKALGMVIITFLVAKFGTIALASYGIGSRILSFIIIPSLGLSMELLH